MARYLAAFMAVIAALFYTINPVAADEIRPFALELREQTAGEWQLSWKQPLSGRAEAASSNAQSGVPHPALIIPKVPENCTILDDPVVRQVQLSLIANVRLSCTGALGGQTFALPQLSGGADALLRVSPIGGATQSHRLTAHDPAITIAARQSGWDVAKTYFLIGIEHILAGWDHLLFVIALVLLVVRGWSVVKAATAFTVAHSITLAATTLGFAGLPQAFVEALIAFSIVVLAVELVRDRADSWTRRFPWAVAFGFGLLHGFGFAGALREIGLPQGEVPTALVTFNLGVEAGQLLVIGAVMVLRWLIQHFFPQLEARAIKVATYIIGIISSFWLIERLL